MSRRSSIDSEEMSGQFSWPNFFARLIILLVIIYLVYRWRPLFHWIIYRIAFSPGGLLLGGIPLVSAVLLFLYPSFGSDGVESARLKLLLVGLAGALGLGLLIVIAIPGAMVEERTIAQQTMADAEQVDDFPQVNPENARIVPRQVSDVQTRGAVSYRKYELGTSDIARMEDGRLAWSYAIIPDGFRNALYEHQTGVVMSDMTSMDDSEIQAHDDQPFTNGQGMLLHRSADWHLKKGDFWTQYRDDPVEFTHDGTAYMYFAKTGHEWHLGPIPHTTPTWEGGALVHPDGTIEHLSPEEAQTHPVLEGQRLYPLYNTKQEMESLGYRNGIVNQMGIIGAHEDQVEIASMPNGSGNSQPFVIDLAGEQMSYVTAMEAHGDGTRGLDEVWFANATTGEYTFYGTGSETLDGPEQAMGAVRSSDTRTDWGDNFEVLEPVPVTVDGALWWHAKVTPTDHRDISRNVFVNSHTGEAIEIHDDEAIKEFLAGSDPSDVDEAQEVTTDEEAAEDEPDVAYYVVIRDQDGNELDRIPIEQGQDVNIVQSEDGGETANNSTDTDT